MNQPSRRDRSRPAELVLFSAGLALFAGLIVLMSTRHFGATVVSTGVIFIVVLVVVAMLTLAQKPDDEERLDLDEQDRGH